MSTVVGIDLGTTNSCVAYITKMGTVECITNSEGYKTTPSVIQVNSTNEIVVGDIAKKEQCIMSDETISFAKRFMDVPDNLDFKQDGKIYSAIDASSLILKKLKNDAESFLNDTVKDAVITVPAYFDINAKQATIQAAELIGLNVLQLIMEPSAAAIYYSFANANEFKNKRVAIFDFGGGTFDISIVDMNEGQADIVSTGGDPRLGGKDIDAILVNIFKKYINDDFPNHSIDFEDNSVIAELWETAENTKKTLSNKTVAKIKFRFLKEFRKEITLEEFESAINHLIEESMSHVRVVFEEAMQTTPVDEIILVGGSTRIPLIEKKLEETTGLKPLKNINPDESVALGAALMAKKITFDETELLPVKMANLIKNIELKDIVPHGLGFDYRDSNDGTIRNHILIPQGTTIPVIEETEGFYFEGNSVNHSVTQGDSDDIELVEVIGKLKIEKKLFENNKIVKGNTENRTNISISYEYTQSATIITRVTDLSTKEVYTLELESKNLLTKKEITAKKDIIEKINVE